MIALNYSELFQLLSQRKLDLRSRKEDEKDTVVDTPATSVSRFDLFDIIFVQKKKTDANMLIIKDSRRHSKMFVIIRAVAPFFDYYRSSIFDLSHNFVTGTFHRGLMRISN